MDKKTNFNRKLSPEDRLYESLTGNIPVKAGTAYERLATAACMIVLKSDNAHHDVKLKGITGTTHQLDGVIDENTILEAKDHTLANDKVNLNELQNHQGAMLDLEEVNRGLFASATGYTKDAIQYATGTYCHPRLIKTDIAHIRHSEPEDEEGRIKEICIKLVIPFLASDKGKYELAWEDKTHEAEFCKVMSGHKLSTLGLRSFFDKNGVYKCSLEEISNAQLSNDWGKEDEVTGIFTIDSYINVYGHLLYIDKLKYKIPVEKIQDCFIVKKEGEPCILFKCDSLDINTLITDVEMKEALDRLK